MPSKGAPVVAVAPLRSTSMTSDTMSEELARLLLLTPRGALWETVRSMTTSRDDALAVMAVTILAQSVVDARLVLNRVTPTDHTRAEEIEAIVHELLHGARVAASNHS